MRTSTAFFLMMIANTVVAGEEPKICAVVIPTELVRMEAVTKRFAAGEAVLAALFHSSFGESWGIRLISSGGEYILAYVSFDGSFWVDEFQHQGEESLRTIPVPTVHLMPVSSELAGVLIREWTWATANPIKYREVSLDGETVTFLMPGMRCAQVWSPRADSRAGKAVDMLRGLRKDAIQQTPPADAAEPRG